MWRSVRVRQPKRKLLLFNQEMSMLYSTSAPKSSGSGKKIVFTIAVAAAGGGLTLAYAKYDPNLRKSIENSVPYSSNLFEALFDSKAPVKNPALEVPPLRKPVEKLGKPREEKPIEPSLMLKRQDPKQENDVKYVERQVAEPRPSSAKQDTVTKQTGTQTVSSGTDFGNSMKHLMDDVEKAFQEATVAQESAIKAIKIHASRLNEAIEASEKAIADQLWMEVESSSNTEKEAILHASNKVFNAEEILKKFRDEIKQNRFRTGSESSNYDLENGERAADKIEYQLKKSSNILNSAQIESEATTEYKNLILKYRALFSKELQIVLPKAVLKGQVLTDEELQILVNHAHGYIERLQKELAKLQVSRKEKAAEAMYRQISEEGIYNDAQLAFDLGLEKTRMEMSYLTELEFIKNEFEAEMRQQLRRQAAVHADHLNEALMTQQQEMERRHSSILEDKLLIQKGKFISEIYKSLASLKEVEDFLAARVQLDEGAKKAQTIWFACQSLKNALKRGTCCQPKPLARYVAFIQAASNENNVFITTMVAGIPGIAVERGIYTDEYLKQRFHNVDNSCRKVAMITETNCSLYQYFLSYLQSLLIVKKKHVPKAELEGKVGVDPTQWDTFDILSRVNYCLQSNDMEQALRYACLLKGEPKNLARDWISEVRLLLETSQAIDCLVAYAASVGVQAIH